MEELVVIAIWLAFLAGFGFGVISYKVGEWVVKSMKPEEVK